MGFCLIFEPKTSGHVFRNVDGRRGGSGCAAVMVVMVVMAVMAEVAA